MHRHKVRILYYGAHQRDNLDARHSTNNCLLGNSGTRISTSACVTSSIDDVNKQSFVRFVHSRILWRQKKLVLSLCHCSEAMLSKISATWRALFALRSFQIFTCLFQILKLFKWKFKMVSC